MNVRHLFLLAPLAFALGACSDDDDHDFEATAAARAEARAANPAPVALFNPSPDPAAQALPSPNDLGRQGSEDGTLNLPTGGDDELSNPRVALNLADGFSTVAPISTRVSTDLDPDSLRVGDTIRVFELETDPMTGMPTALGTELDATRLVASVVEGEADRDTDGDEDIDGDDRATYRLVLLPTTPLTPATTHAVFLTSGITSTDGRPLGADSVFNFLRAGTPLLGDPDFEQALLDFNPALRGPEAAPLAVLQSLEPLRAGFVRPPIELVAAAEDPIAQQDIALSWTFTTQGITEVLAAVEGVSVPRPLAVAPSGQSTAVAGGRGAADIFVGSLAVPYYQVPVPVGGEVGVADFLAATNGFWVPASGQGEVVTRFDPLPLARGTNGDGTQTIPVLMTVPNDSSGQTVPESGWPVAIFQHGITRNRTDMLAVADAMAGAGFVVVAIDLPVHGILERDTDLAPFRATGGARGTERNFGIDLFTEAADGTITALAPDGVEDSSGRHFYNPANLVNSRDNLRQGVSDLLTLSDSLAGLQVVVDEAGTLQPFPIDASRKAFVGHSLGAIVGTTFLAFDDSVTSATLAMPGGGIAQLLANSPAFGPSLLAGVTAANGGELSAAQYQEFLVAAQTLVDSGDPINHAGTVAANGATAVHLIEVVGEPDVSLPDQVIPNAVAGAPLAGTEPLARELGLEAIVESATSGALVRFSRGTHGSILDPASDPTPDGIDLTEAEGAAGLAVTTEMQTQTATFAATGGTSLPIADASVVAPLDVEIETATLPVLPTSGGTEGDETDDDETDDGETDDGGTDDVETDDGETEDGDDATGEARS